MWTISQIICMGVLAGLAVLDMHSRQIPVSILVLGSLAALGYQVFVGKEYIWIIFGGIGVGALFLLVSKVTREGMGYGDSWAISILGIYLGIWKLLETLFAAFLFLGVAAVICLSVKKMPRKYKIPFVPFLAIGYLCSILSGGMDG